MTCKVTVTAESHDCEIRELPVVNGEELPWDSLSEETRRFAVHVVRKGEAREFHIHSGRSLLIRESQS